jgi:hypothetical protein
MGCAKMQKGNYGLASRLTPLIMVSTIMALSTATVAFAADGATTADPASGDNIFSTPDSQTQHPSFAQQRPLELGEPGGNRGKGGRLRKMLSEGADGLPTFQQIRSLPSITPAQRRDLKKIYTSLKDQAGPMMEQVKQMRNQNPDPQDRRKALQDPATRAKLREMREQLTALRSQASAQVRTILTPEQYQEIAAMKKGEMQPATFNDPMIGNTRRGMRGRLGSANGLQQAPLSDGKPWGRNTAVPTGQGAGTPRNNEDVPMAAQDSAGN